MSSFPIARCDRARYRGFDAPGTLEESRAFVSRFQGGVPVSADILDEGGFSAFAALLGFQVAGGLALPAGNMYCHDPPLVVFFSFSFVPKEASESLRAP